MEEGLSAEIEELRDACAKASPAVRLRAIRQRLARTGADAGPGRLVAVLAGTEALARSLVVHASGRPSATAAMRYKQFSQVGVIDLVEEVLRLRAGTDAARHYPEATWARFKLAEQCRDLVVHDCSFLDPGSYPPLVDAVETVLESLVEVAGLPRAVT